MKPAIRVDKLSKQYRIGTRTSGSYRTLRDSLANALSAPFRRWRGGVQDGICGEAFWAVKDVSFEVQPGEVVGIIGGNGAGKSTLLKIFSRVVEPTSGRTELRGHVASLLEVGTGFHPELTGRENIFLNGSILGLSRKEIHRQFDEIVSFSEIERFLDTPVKWYSSGMYVRLAFAVAAHLQPEILIVDEVLAVGDAQFQKKCLGKMGDVRKSGRTVLFVSHNMAAVQTLCTRGVLLRNGKVVFDGRIQQCIQEYLGNNGRLAEGGTANLNGPNVARRGNGDAQFSEIELLDADGQATSIFQFAQPMRVRLTIDAKVALSDVTLGFSYIASDGTEVQGTSAHDCGQECHLRPGKNRLECIVDPMVLTPGTFGIRAAIFRPPEVFDHIDELIMFRVDPSRHQVGLGPRNHYVGYSYVPYQWIHLGK